MKKKLKKLRKRPGLRTRPFFVYDMIRENNNDGV